MKTVEYITADCPIMGKVIIRNYIEVQQPTKNNRHGRRK